MSKTNLAQVTRIIVLVGLELLTHGTHVRAAMDSDVDRLVNDLKGNYSVYARPPRNQSETLEVQFGFSLQVIREFDERNEKFSVIGTVILAWMDDRIVWNPTEYAGLETIVVDNNVFWTPSVFLTNNVEELKRIGSDPYWKVRFYYYGYAEFYPDGYFSSICSPDVVMFPWDTQTCILKFSVSGYSEDEVLLKPYNSTDDAYFVPLVNFLGDGLWDVKDRDVHRYGMEVAVSYTLKRKPLLSVINILVPVVLMSCLSIFVFVIPAESGERITFGLTVLLALAVFLTLVSDGMPKSATSIATLSYYLIASLAFNILLNILIILNLKLYFRGENKPVPRCLQTFARCLLCKTQGKNKSKVNADNRRAQSDTEVQIRRNHHNGQEVMYHLNMSEKDSSRAHNSAKDRSSAFLVVRGASSPRSGYSSGRQSGSRSGNSVENEHINVEKVTWKTVSSAIDLVLFVFSAIALVMITIIFFVRARG